MKIEHGSPRLGSSPVPRATRGQSPLTDGHAGLRVVEVLEAASESMREGGRMIEVPRAEEADLRVV